MDWARTELVCILSGEGEADSGFLRYRPCGAVSMALRRLRTRLGRVAVWHTTLAIGLSACAQRNVHPDTAGLAPAGGGDARASLEVENNTTLDVRIFLLRAAMPTRLGTVTGMSTARFDLTLDMLGRDVRFYASPVGGRQRTITDMIVVKPGQLVSLHLDNMMRSYRLSVW